MFDICSRSCFALFAHKFSKIYRPSKLRNVDFPIQGYTFPENQLKSNPLVLPPFWHQFRTISKVFAALFVNLFSHWSPKTIPKIFQKQNKKAWVNSTKCRIANLRPKSATPSAPLFVFVMLASVWHHFGFHWLYLGARFAPVRSPWLQSPSVWPFRFFSAPPQFAGSSKVSIEIKNVICNLCDFRNLLLKIPIIYQATGVQIESAGFAKRKTKQLSHTLHFRM